MSRLEFVARLLFVLAAFGLAGGVTEARADKWTGPDKTKHVGLGAAYGSAMTLITDRDTAIWTGVALAAAKEWQDGHSPGHTRSFKDFAVSAAAITLSAHNTDLVLRAHNIDLVLRKGFFGMQFNF